MFFIMGFQFKRLCVYVGVVTNLSGCEETQFYLIEM